MGILLSIPIAIIYNLLVSKVSAMITKDDVMKEKIQKNIIIDIVFGIVALVLAYYVFGKSRLKNGIVKYGLALGGIILLIYSMICNWDSIEDQTKLFVIGGSLLFMILYSYKIISNNNAVKDK
jgi:hypothetical protein